MYNRIKIVSPINQHGFYELWDWVDTPHGPRSGKRPKSGDCDGPEYLESFTFDFPEVWELRNTLGKYVGPLSYNQFRSEDRAHMFKTFLEQVDAIMTSEGFPGECSVLGLATRRGKQAWKFSVTGANYRVHNNFILAKLMGKESFEEKIWREVARQKFPNALII